MAAGSKGVSEVVGAGPYILGRGKEKGDRGSNGFGVGFRFGQRGVEWSERIEWIGLECSGRVNDPILTTGRN